MQPKEGTIVAERFRLVRVLGRGGMGEVWLAHDARLEAPCAVKFLLGAGLDRPDVRARFEREAKAAAQLRSPNVVQIFDHGELLGLPYIAMELLDGEDLATRLKRVGHLPPSAVLEIVEQVSRALTRAHAAGLVHRDLKPANIFLVPDEEREIVKVLDFGIVKIVAPGAPMSLRAPQTTTVASATQTGALMGTPSYMSPEQAIANKEIDTRSDLFSLAIVTYQCLTGQLPFVSDDVTDLVMKILVDPIAKPSSIVSELPESVDVWFERASERDPADRFQTAREFADELERALRGGDAGALRPIESAALRPSPEPRSRGDETTAATGLATTNAPSSKPVGRPPSALDLREPPPARTRRTLYWGATVASVAVLAGAVVLMAKYSGGSAGTASSRSTDVAPDVAPPPPPVETSRAVASVSGSSSARTPAPPLAIREPGRVLQVTLSSAHACARFDGGVVKCWGDLRSIVPDGHQASPPTLLPGVEDAIDVAAHPGSICILHATHRVTCFGRMGSGLGGVPMGELRDVASLARGGPAGIFCAVRLDGRVVCLGGEGMRREPDHTITGLHDIRQVVLADYHQCALEASGKVLCWGKNARCQLAGDVSLSESEVPLEVPGATHIAQIAAGTNHTCARRDDGKVLCWGDPISNELGYKPPIRETRVPDGIEVTLPDRVTATPVEGVKDALDIAAGHNDTCAALKSGKVVCWGEDWRAYRETLHANPKWATWPVEGVAAIELALASRSVCALTPSATVQCWGDDYDRQLGFDSPHDCGGSHCPAPPGLVSGL